MAYWLPLIFAAVMGLALLIYIILDGYDLGIGLLLPFANETEKDQMIASIGPFWDANETWIVLGVGILLIAFPTAHGVVLTSLYLPVTIMLFGLILRGVAFDFRVKAPTQHRTMWNRLFSTGSFIAASAQGWMLGYYVTGLQMHAISYLFATAIALALPVLYIMLGAAWLTIKTEGMLMQKAKRWMQRSVLPFSAGLFLISISTPLASPLIADKWFSFPNFFLLLPIPLITILALAKMILELRKPAHQQSGPILFGCLVLICVMSALGLAYSLFPDIILGQMTLWESAAATESLLFAFIGVVITVPAILIYTVFIYRVFRGKVVDLNYGGDPV